MRQVVVHVSTGGEALMREVVRHLKQVLRQVVRV